MCECVDCLKKIHSARTDEVVAEAEETLRDMPLESLALVAQSREYHAGLRALAARYYIQFVLLAKLSEERQSIITQLLNDDSAMVRLGVAVGAGEAGSATLLYSVTLLQQLLLDRHEAVVKEVQGYLETLKEEAARIEVQFTLT